MEYMIYVRPLQGSPCCREARAAGNINLLTGQVKVDETYLDGKERNKHRDKKNPWCPVGKQAVVAPYANAQDLSVSYLLPPTIDKATLHEVIRKIIAPTMTVYIDEHSGDKEQAYDCGKKKADNSLTLSSSPARRLAQAQTEAVSGRTSPLKKR